MRTPLLRWSALVLATLLLAAPQPASAQFGKKLKDAVKRTAEDKTIEKVTTEEAQAIDGATGDAPAAAPAEGGAAGDTGEAPAAEGGAAGATPAAGAAAPKLWVNYDFVATAGEHGASLAAEAQRSERLETYHGRPDGWDTPTLRPATGRSNASCQSVSAQGVDGPMTGFSQPPRSISPPLENGHANPGAAERWMIDPIRAFDYFVVRLAAECRVDRGPAPHHLGGGGGEEGREARADRASGRGHGRM